MSTLRRFASLVLRPSAEWQAIAAEPITVDALLLRVILPFALLAPIATVIGMNVFDARWDPLQGYLVPPEQIFAAAATTFFAVIGSIFGLAAIFVLLAPMFGSSRDYRAALKVAAYGALPVMLAGGAMLLPAMVVVGMVALCHTLYLYWVGARCVLHVRADHLSEFVGISTLLLGAFSVLAGAAASSVGLI
ncbi:MAG: YIP1 family protein [Betaproteobacteria bacterium]|nr:YIP1 family protein [Betaproteobacteria bacterium]